MFLLNFKKRLRECEAIFSTEKRLRGRRFEREARVGIVRKTTNGHHQLALAQTHHGVRKKKNSRRKTSKEKSSKKRKPWVVSFEDGIILYNLVVKWGSSAQAPLVAEPHREDWGGYFLAAMRTLSACLHECPRQTEPTHLSIFCWISPHKWYLLVKWFGPV